MEYPEYQEEYREFSFFNYMTQDISAARIIDANFNRATEGLRVIEDYARFVLGDRVLSAQSKSLRHQLKTVLTPWARSMIRRRDTTGDVGTEIQTHDEYSRSDKHAVAKASCKRVQQALRSIEEYSKLTSVVIARQIEQLRYEAYTLELAIQEVCVGRDVLEHCRICLLVDCEESAETFASQIDLLVSSGITMFQLRDKKADDRLLIERFKILRERTSHSNATLILNDRSDLALMLKADGVHLGQDDLPISQSRQILNSNQLIGVSTHSIEQARQAVSDGANYIGVGPVFPSRTKQFETYPGPKLVQQVSEEIGVPAFAIGGVNSSNVNTVIQNGIHRVAVSGAIWGNPDALREIQKLRQALNVGEN